MRVKLLLIIVAALVALAGTHTSSIAQQVDSSVNLMLSNLPAGKDPQRYQGYIPPKYQDVVERSLYVTMRDGVRIAIDVAVPRDLPATEKIPAVMRMTRYWRSQAGSQGNLQFERFFWHAWLCRGYG